jgi:hypothetical protein
MLSKPVFLYLMSLYSNVQPMLSDDSLGGVSQPVAANARPSFGPWVQVAGDLREFEVRKGSLGTCGRAVRHLVRALTRRRRWAE